MKTFTRTVRIEVPDITQVCDIGGGDINDVHIDIMVSRGIRQKVAEWSNLSESEVGIVYPNRINSPDDAAQIEDLQQKLNAALGERDRLRDELQTAKAELTAEKFMRKASNANVDALKVMNRQTRRALLAAVTPEGEE